MASARSRLWRSIRSKMNFEKIIGRNRGPLIHQKLREKPSSGSYQGSEGTMVSNRENGTVSSGCMNNRSPAKVEPVGWTRGAGISATQGEKGVSVVISF